MWTIRIWISLGLFVFAFGCVNAWAVVPYTLPPDLVKAETVQREKQEILKRIERLKSLDPNAMKDIQDALKQVEDKNSDSLSKKEVPEEGH